MTATEQEDPVVQLDLEHPKRLFKLALGALVVIFGLWAGLTHINGAVIANGTAIVEGRTYPVQSLNGGIVDQIYVRDGDFVEAGTTLIRFDPKLLSIQVESARARLGAVMAKLERLQAEQRGAETLTFDYPSLPVALPATAEFEAIERDLFNVRQAMRLGRAETLTETIAQLLSQQQGGQGQLRAIEEQVTTVSASIEDMRQLVDQQLLRRRELEAELGRRADLMGRMAALQADQGRFSEAIREARIQASQAERQFQEEIAAELAALNDEVQQLTLEIATREEELARVNVSAPADGIIQDLVATSSGAVVAPNQTIMEIIPVTANIQFEARVPPIGIDEVAVGQTAEIVVAAFDANATPRIFGTVQQISATSMQDERTGESFYEAIVAVPDDQMAQLNGQEIVPGMPVSVFLQTEARSVLSFLVEPIFDPLSRAFRE